MPCHLLMTTVNCGHSYFAAKPNEVRATSTSHSSPRSITYLSHSTPVCNTIAKHVEPLQVVSHKPPPTTVALPIVAVQNRPSCSPCHNPLELLYLYPSIVIAIGTHWALNRLLLVFFPSPPLSRETD